MNALESKIIGKQDKSNWSRNWIGARTAEALWLKSLDREKKGQSQLRVADEERQLKWQDYQRENGTIPGRKPTGTAEKAEIL